MKKKIAIKDFVESVDFRLSDCFEHQWECFGHTSFGLNWESRDKQKSACMVFDGESQTVCEVSVWDGNDVYRWINPLFVAAVKREYKKRGLKFAVALDKIKYKDVSVATILNRLKKTVSSAHSLTKKERSVSAGRPHVCDR